MTRDKRDRSKSPIAEALRREGYVPLPRWWVTPDQMEVIRRMALGNEENITKIRVKAYRKYGHPEGESRNEPKFV